MTSPIGHRFCLLCLILPLAVAAYGDGGTIVSGPGPDGAPGLRYAYYEAEVATLLDLTELKPARTGVLPDLSLPRGARDEYFAVEWYGSVEIPTDGDYTFYTESDDGSLLAIGDQLVVENDYDHGATEKSGKVHLAAGHHPIWAAYFQGAGDKAWSVAWEGPGIEKSGIPASALSQSDKAYRLPEGAPKTTSLEWPEIGVRFDVCVDTRAETSLDFMQDAIPETIRKHFPVIWAKVGTERTKMPAVVRFTIRHGIDVPAYAAGSGIVFSAEHFTRNPDDLGCVIHELTHIVQSYRDIPEGTGWIVEGLADYVRYRSAADHSGWGIQVPYREGMQYTEGYGTAAGFFIWIEKAYDPDMAVKLARALKLGTYTPDIWVTSTGKSLDELWEEYKTVPAPVPARPDAQ